MSKKLDQDLLKTARLACQLAQKQGAQAVAANAQNKQGRILEIRDGKKEQIKSTESRSLVVRLFVNGRYGIHQTHDMKPEAIRQFIADAVEMTGYLMPDPLRALPQEELYKGRSDKDLRLADPDFAKVTLEQLIQAAQTAHDAARSAAGKHLISAAGGAGSESVASVLCHSDGFEDGAQGTEFAVWSDTSVQDPAGKRPSDWFSRKARFWSELADPAQVGTKAAERARQCIGAEKIASCNVPLIVENRAAGRLIGGLLAPLEAQALDQKRSCFPRTVLGLPLAASVFSMKDDPLLPGGWGSRRFDSEGITATPRPIFEKGVFKSYYIDTYYGKKLKMRPTTRGPSNLVFPVGDKDLAGLMAAAGKAILVTAFLGGNSNSTTGDFSHGIQGFLVENGKISRPVASMNVAANHLKFWKSLRETGNDPYAESNCRIPSLLFHTTLVAGK